MKRAIKPKSTRLLALALAAAFSIAIPNHAAPLQSSLMLSITLDDIYNRNFQVNLPVAVNQPFKVVTSNGIVTDTISGTVGTPKSGKYPVPLYVSEWSGKDSNLVGTTDYNLEIGKPDSTGLTSSVVYMRTVKLTLIPH